MDMKGKLEEIISNCTGKEIAVVKKHIEDLLGANLIALTLTKFLIQVEFVDENGDGWIVTAE